MNTRYNKLVGEGYSYVGISSKTRDVVEERANKYRTMGNKVAIVTKVETSPRRGMPNQKETWFVALVLFSERYKAFQQAESDKRKADNRLYELKQIAKALTIEEALAIVKMKYEEVTNG